MLLKLVCILCRSIQQQIQQLNTDLSLPTYLSLHLSNETYNHFVEALFIMYVSFVGSFLNKIQCYSYSSYICVGLTQAYLNYIGHILNVQLYAVQLSSSQNPLVYILTLHVYFCGKLNANFLPLTIVTTVASQLAI